MERLTRILYEWVFGRYSKIQCATLAHWSSIFSTWSDKSCGIDFAMDVAPKFRFDKLPAVVIGCPISWNSNDRPYER